MKHLLFSASLATLLGTGFLGPVTAMKPGEEEATPKVFLIKKGGVDLLALLPETAVQIILQNLQSDPLTPIRLS